jgi:hypothetical protein
MKAISLFVLLAIFGVTLAQEPFGCLTSIVPEKRGPILEIGDTGFQLYDIFLLSFLFSISFSFFFFDGRKILEFRIRLPTIAA